MHRAVTMATALTPAVVLCLLAAPTTGLVGDDRISLTASTHAVSVTPEQDDASLHAVELIGSRLGWAVGDRGVVWRTADGGATWQLCPTPVASSLRSVCFLTDQLGWAVGGHVAPAGRVAEGVVLGTTDGGATWTVLAQTRMPYLVHVQFFGLEEGVAVGCANRSFPTGVAITRDGGKTWSPAEGVPSQGWRAAAFIDEQTGSLAGLRGRFTTLGGGAVVEQTGDPFGLRGLYDIDLQPDGRGWMVGDGGLVLATTTAGANWAEPRAPLPTATRDFFDARAVAGHQDHVWIAGAPGSAIWHSPDAGHTWESQPIGSPAPLHAIDFSSESRGCAVGAFGRILVTNDGGASWTAARGGDRRAALLAMHSRDERAPLRLLIRASAEEGYRAVVQLTSRRDVGPDGHLHADADLRLQDAVTAAGANDSDIAWKLPVGVPGLDEDYARLLKQWTAMTDGRLPDVMLQDLVADLRTWRPDVVVVDEPSENEAAARLLRQAILHAAEQAADPNRFPQQQQLMHLAPWTVQRVYTRMPDGQNGEITLDPHAILPRHGRTLLMAAAPATGRLGVENPAEGESFRLVLPPREVTTAPRRWMLTGLSLSPGGPARRALPPITELDFDAIQNLAQHQRNFAAWRDRALDNPAQAAQVIAQLGDVLANAPPHQAALQLADLADAYRQRSQWQLTEEALIELAERFPNEPAAIEGMVYLLQMWTSLELGWQREQGVSAEQNMISVRGDVAQAAVNQTENLLSQQGGLDRVRELAQNPTSPLLIQPIAGEVRVGGQENQRKFDRRRWHEQATLLAGELKRRAPAVYQTPEVQFACAALFRQREMYQESDKIYREFALTADPAWQQAARGELWALGSPTESPKPVLICKRVAAPPLLDGLLGDACWQSARDIELTPPVSEREGEDAAFVGTERLNTGDGRRAAKGTGAIAMLTYDSEYLYFGASLPRAEGLPADAVEYPGRDHDADLAGFDRVSLLLDIDRDYATYYRLDVDSRGQTRDACWTDQRWNPRWYVANDADSSRWTIEAAIPLKELAPRAAVGGQIWGVGIVRTMPAVGVESWTHPTGSVPRPATFGLMRMQ